MESITNTNAFFDRICENYKDDSIKDLNIGFAHSSWPFILLPSLALSLNIFIIITHVRKNLSAK